MAQTHTTPGERIANARLDVGWKPNDLIAEVRRRLGKEKVFSPQTLRNIETGRTRRPDTYTAHAIVFVLNLRGRQVDPQWEDLRVSELWPEASR